MVFDTTVCHIPADTFLEEKNVRCKGDVVVGDRATFRRGIITEGRVFIGEFAEVRGDIVSIGDVRMDRGTRIKGNMTADENVYIGERAIVQGEVNVGRDLDIGEGAQLDPSSIESKGFINIRNPVSMIIYLLLYILERIRDEDSEGVESFLAGLEDDSDGETYILGTSFAFFPRACHMDSDTLIVPGDLKIGPGCTIVGDLVAEGSVEIERGVQVFGDVRSKGSLYVGENAVINGMVRSGGDVTVHHAARIGGDVHGHNVVVTSDTIIEGVLKGDAGVQVVRGDGASIETEGGVKGGLDIVSAITEMER
jgi:predicted acyltransferase (DUF342 family)